jgi:hypothetical protein
VKRESIFSRERREKAAPASLTLLFSLAPTYYSESLNCITSKNCDFAIGTLELFF